MQSGKQIRNSRFRYAGVGTGLIVPLDHGLTLGPVEGVGSIEQISTWIRHPAICGVVVHKGMLERLASRGLLDGKGIYVHLNGMSSIAPHSNNKQMLTSVETAMRIGADGISLQLNFDGSNDAHNLALLGLVVDQAQTFGLPVLTMLYDKVVLPESEKQIARLLHLIRICIELGTDSIKLAPPRNSTELKQLLLSTHRDVAIYFAGGDLMRDEELLSLTREAKLHGAAGLCVGRNIFQRKDPGVILNRIKESLLVDSEYALQAVLKTMNFSPRGLSDAI